MMLNPSESNAPSAYGQFSNLLIFSRAAYSLLPSLAIRRTASKMWRFGIFSVLLLSGFCLAAPRSSFEYPGPPLDRRACQCVAPQDCLNGNGFYFQYIWPSTDFTLKEMCENHGEICCAVASVIKHESRTTTQEKNSVSKKCGLRNPEGLDPYDIVERKDEAKFGEFPWMVALLGKSKPNAQGQVALIFSGGGSLIHPKAVITAAHCVANRYTADQITIRAGEWDPRNENEYLPHRHRDAQKIIVHEDYYNIKSRHHDFAIIILKTPFNLAPHIGLACLPDRMTTFDATRCVSTGWGRKVFSQGSNEKKILKKIELPLVPNDACVKMYHKSGYSDFSLHASYLCAGGKYGKDTCSFDSGGPLVCPILDEPTRYVQVGIVAAGPANCGTEGLPGLYSDVIFGRRWILRQLADNGIYIDN